MSGVLFEDIFEVGKLNPDGKKFDRGEPGDNKKRQGEEASRNVSSGPILGVQMFCTWRWGVVLVPEQGACLRSGIMLTSICVVLYIYRR